METGNPLNLLTPISADYLNYTEDIGATPTNSEHRGMLGKRFHIKAIKYGGMGEVYLCSLKRNEKPTVALKTFQMQFFFDPFYRISFENESVNWSMLSGLPHIMPVLGIEEYDNRIFIMVPCVANPDNINTLRDKMNLQKCSLNQKLKYFLQCILAMNHANSRFRGLVHGDLKPENIMLINDNIYITDFGLSKTFDEIENHSIKINLESTWAYKAPELWIKENQQSTKSDIYALGVILYEMLCDKLPIQAVSKDDWEKAHLFSIPSNSMNYDEKFKKFLNLSLKCLSKNPEERPEYNSLLQEFNKIWKEVDIINHFTALFDQIQIMQNFSDLQELTKGQIVSGLIKLGRPDLALEEIKNLESTAITPEILHSKATSLSLLFRDEEAIIIFKELLNTNISKDLKVECLNELGLSYKRVSRFDEAESIYLNDLIPIAKRNDIPKIITNLGTVYLVNEKYDKAISLLTTMLREIPENAEGWGNLGLAYLGKKDFHNAIDCFRKTLVIKPGMAMIQVRLAEAYMFAGMAENSYALLDSAWSQGYNTIDWLENMITACFFTEREGEMSELMAMAENDLGKERLDEIMQIILKKIDTIIEELSNTSEKIVVIDEENKSENEENKTRNQNQVYQSTEFSMPFLNLRYYMDENNYSIDFYFDTRVSDIYAKEFEKCYKQSKNDPRMKPGNMQLRPTLFYFTECPSCKIEILTNRDKGKSLSCRSCNHRFTTISKEDAELTSLLEKCIELVELKIEKRKDQSILILIQPREGHSVDALKTFFLKSGYNLRSDIKSTIVSYLRSEMVKRKLFTIDEPIFAFDKDFPNELIGYEGELPEDVETIIRNLKSEFPNMRSTSTFYETNPEDIAGLIMTGKYQEALALVNKELKKTHDEYGLMMLKITILMELNKGEDAKLLAVKVLNQNTEKPAAWSIMGEVLIKEGNYEKAIPFLQKSILMDPVDPLPLVRLSECYKETSNNIELNKIYFKLKTLGHI